MNSRSRYFLAFCVAIVSTLLAACTSSITKPSAVSGPTTTESSREAYHLKFGILFRHSLAVATNCSAFDETFWGPVRSIQHYGAYLNRQIGFDRQGRITSYEESGQGQRSNSKKLEIGYKPDNSAIFVDIFRKQGAEYYIDKRYEIFISGNNAVIYGFYDDGTKFEHARCVYSHEYRTVVTDFVAAHRYNEKHQPRSKMAEVRTAVFGENLLRAEVWDDTDISRYKLEYDSYLAQTAWEAHQSDGSVSTRERWEYMSRDSYGNWVAADYGLMEEKFGKLYWYGKPTRERRTLIYY